MTPQRPQYLSPSLPDDQAADAPGSRIDLGPGVWVSPEALRFSFTTSSGPGGQNVNKRATRAELRLRLADLPIPADAAQRLAKILAWRLTDEGEILIDADEHRSQLQNKRACVERLRELVIKSLVRPKTRRPTKPTKGSQRRRIEEKKRRGNIKRGRKDDGD
jgi:ribosome-associated protein